MRATGSEKERKNPEGNQDQNVFVEKEKKKKTSHLSTLFLGLFAWVINFDCWPMADSSECFCLYYMQDGTCSTLRPTPAQLPPRSSCKTLTRNATPSLSRPRRKGPTRSSLTTFYASISCYSVGPVSLSVLLREPSTPSDFPLAISRWPWLSIRVQCREVAVV